MYAMTFVGGYLLIALAHHLCEPDFDTVTSILMYITTLYKTSPLLSEVTGIMYPKSGSP